MAESHTAHPTVRMLSEIPERFLARMATLLSDEYAAFLASYDEPPSVGLRVNTLKISVDAFRAIAPFELTPVSWCPAGFTLTDEAAPGKHSYHAAGLYYLQDPSAMAAVELLDPQPGECVLDLAAAPGGKATHIAARMQGQGLLVANEIHPKRAWELAGNLERWGARNAAITNETPERMAERFPGFFDRVLADAPCSGEGMMRKSETARREWAPELVNGCALRQTGILDQAATMVRPGGRLVYSTCTFNPEENERTVARFLTRHTDFALIESPQRPGYFPGRPAWLPENEGKAELACAIRLWPHHAPGEGHFIAALERSRSPAAPAAKSWRPVKLPRPVGEAYRTFCAANLNGMPAVEQPALVGSYLYALPPELPDLAGLRYLHPGWWLGVVKGARFEPSHALALALSIGDAHRVLDLPAGAPELTAYMHGETPTNPGEEGWTLVAVDGYSIGWGKRSGGRLKSHYPKGLRRPQTAP